MSAETVQPRDSVIDTLASVEPGDRLEVAAAAYAWKAPLTVESATHTEWVPAAGDSFCTSRVEIGTDRGTTYRVDVLAFLDERPVLAGDGYDHGELLRCKRVTDDKPEGREPTDPESDWWTARPAVVPVRDTVDDWSLLGDGESGEPVASNEPHWEDYESKADIASDIREYAGEDPEPNRGGVSKSDMIQIGLRCRLAESIVGYPVRTIVAELEDELGVSIETGSDGKPTRDGLETLRDAFLEQVPAPGQDDHRGMMSTTGGGVW